MGLLSGIKKGISSIAGYFGEGSQAVGSPSVAVSPWAAVAQGALDIGTGMINNAYAISAAQRDYRYAKQLIDYQNEYNLPINQRARLEAAGLNPNYILGGVSSTSASGSASGGSGGKMQNNLNLASYYNLEAQNALLDANAERVRVQSELDALKIATEVEKARKASADADVSEREAGIYLDTGISPVFQRYVPFGGVIGRSVQEHSARYVDRKFPVEVYDESKPALGSNVKRFSKDRPFIWWPW